MLSMFRIRPFHLGIAVSILMSIGLFYAAPFGMSSQRELYFDWLTQTVSAPKADIPIVVDMGQDATGERWQRRRIADLANKIALGNPKVVAYDMVFSGDCDAADGSNIALAEALGAAPSVLGFLIGSGTSEPPQPQPPLMTAKPIYVPNFWFIAGAESACPIFQAKAKSAAGAFLVGDDDARVRRVQAYSVIGDAAYPSLALEAIRLADGAGTIPILGGLDLWLKSGRRQLNLIEQGNIRFRASSQDAIDKRTIAATDVLNGNISPDIFAGRIVFVGNSAPAMGGLRESASMPLEPSVQIHADAATAILSGFIPMRDYRFTRYEALYVLFAGVLIALTASRYRPAVIASIGLTIIGLTIALSLAIYVQTAYLTDGLSTGLSLGAVLAVTVFFQFAHARRTARLARDRFGQYLPQSVVSRYLDGGKMSGEERRVTALFTDIEGFSTLTKTMTPQALVGLLDTYFTEVNALVAAHGGMVDKVVGDAVHALFNAPEDLEGHVDAAIACALEISRLTEEMRTRPEFAEAKFGRTRIGIETGDAVIGEVGAGGKLDYTAHGDAINLAARLQEANKFLGTAICVGPVARQEASHALQALGDHEIRGFGVLSLFTPQS